MLEKPHKKLEVWQRSMILVKRTYDLTSSFPKNEEYGLMNQMRRAVVSIPANISEGAARQTKREFIQFFHMAQGSLSELDTPLEISTELGYIGDNDIKDLPLLTNEIDRMLTGLIKSLRR